jgi:hypothetical protein
MNRVTTTPYRIFYRWQQRSYFTVMSHYSAYAALAAAEILLMDGAKPYAIEVAR